MMGIQKSDNSLFCYNVNLNARLPENHYLKKIDRLLDLDFIRTEVDKHYGESGNVSIDPVIIMKLMLLLFLDNISSERELMRMLPYRLDYLWYLGYGLDDKVPHHSVLSKARSRWGHDVFKNLFERVVILCCKHGLIDGEKIYMDGSLIEANASLNSIESFDPEYEQKVEQAIFKTIEKLDEKTKDIEFPQLNKVLKSTTDPEADVIGHTKNKLRARARYKEHRAVDDQCGVITAVETTPGGISEGKLFSSLIEQHQLNTDKKVKVAVGDTAYGISDNFLYCSTHNVLGHMADFNATYHRHKNIYSPEQFEYDPFTDTYICPAGEILTFRGYSTEKNKKYKLYKIKPSVCNKCNLKCKCTTSKCGRKITRIENHDLIERSRKESHTKEAQRDRKRRSYLMEGSFGDAALNHGFKRSRWRGLIKQYIANYIIAAVQNIKKLISKSGHLRPVICKDGLISQKFSIYAIIVDNYVLNKFCSHVQMYFYDYTLRRNKY